MHALRESVSTILTTLIVAISLPVAAAEIPEELSAQDGKPADMKKPVKVYILAGQSNMEGQAKVETFDYIGDDPKTAWGGKSLNTDFRPPSSGPYPFSEAQIENIKKQGKDIDTITSAAPRQWH